MTWSQKETQKMRGGGSLLHSQVLGPHGEAPGDSEAEDRRGGQVEVIAFTGASTERQGWAG